MRFSLLQFLNVVEMKKFACLSRSILTFVDPNQEYLPIVESKTTFKEKLLRLFKTEVSKKG